MTGPVDLIPPAALPARRFPRGLSKTPTSLVLALSIAPITLGAQATRRDSLVQACYAADTSTRWRQVVFAAVDSPGAHWANDSLRRRLLALADSDQAVREAVADSMTDPAYLRRMTVADSAHGGTLREILHRYGWPGRTLVGWSGAHAAWLVAQHVGSLQHEALALMRGMPAGEVAPADLAMLEDRVRVGDGRPQRYGSQLTPGERPTFYPIEDLDHVGSRRAEVGLPPLGLYRCVMRAITGREIPEPRGP